MNDRPQKRIVRSLAACFLSGLLLGISQPLYMPAWFGDVGVYQQYLGLLCLIGYVPLFLTIASKNLKETFWYSFFALTVQLTVVLYWIYIALHDYGDISPIPASIITLLLPLLFSLLSALFFTIGRFLSFRFAVSFYWLAPVVLCASEYFRNYYVFGGFPWGSVGYSLGRIDQFLQSASLVGVYGLVFFIGLINALICLAIKRRAILYVAVVLGLVSVLFGYGVVRLHGSEHEFAQTVRVALLQGNIPQEIKSSARLYAKDILNIYLDLSREAKKEGADLVIWPESAYPRSLRKEVGDLGFTFDDRVATVLGAVVYDENKEGGYYVHNSGLLIDYRGNVVSRYDKSHLVPFGEYVPWPLSGIVDKVVPGMGAFRPGTDFKPVNLPLSESKHILIGTTVCYEGIFPEISRAYAKNGADVLVNLTNDAWYGYSSAPYQHLLMYRMRSAETGLVYLRATNTGVSAWIDSYGRVHKPSSLFERGLIVDNVPLTKKPTLYVMMGDVIPISCLLLLIIAFLGAVLPIHQFIKEKQWSKLLIIFALTTIAILSQMYFSSPQFLTDESARTKNLLVILLCLLLAVGLLTKTRRSRAILITCSVVLVFCSVILSIFESAKFLVGVVLGLLIYLLMFRNKERDKTS